MSPTPMALDRHKLPPIEKFRADAQRIAHDPGAPTIPVAVLLALPYVGQSSTLMSELTGISQPYCSVWIRKVRERMTDERGRFYCQWPLDGFAGEVAFTCDVLVLIGKARRFLDSNGEPLYVINEVKGQVIDPARPETILTENEKLSARREGLMPMRGEKR